MNNANNDAKFNEFNNVYFFHAVDQEKNLHFIAQLGFTLDQVIASLAKRNKRLNLRLLASVPFSQFQEKLVETSEFKLKTEIQAKLDFIGHLKFTARELVRDEEIKKQLNKIITNLEITYGQENYGEVSAD